MEISQNSPQNPDPSEPNGGNVYRKHRKMIATEVLWRCAHGLTGLDNDGTFIGCAHCAAEVVLEEKILPPGDEMIDGWERDPLILQARNPEAAQSKLTLKEGLSVTGIYLASSWRNPLQPQILTQLRDAGHDVYDFRNPVPGESGFSWSEIEPEWLQWNAPAFVKALEHPVAEHGFQRDWQAMLRADVGVLLPCGRSAHIEAGYFVGAGKPLFILLQGQNEPELMYKMATGIYHDPDTLVSAIAEWRRALKPKHETRPVHSDNHDRPSFQERVLPWLLECFGPEIAGDKEERNHRFLEEALELVQACGCTHSEALQLVDYVYGRPIGERAQEVGGVMVTLAALCLAQGLDMRGAGETELARIWTKVEAIRAKQVAKPKHSPLPGSPVEVSLGTDEQAPGRRCGIPPAGWICNRESGHDGPCAAVPKRKRIGMKPILPPGEATKDARVSL